MLIIQNDGKLVQIRAESVARGVYSFRAPDLSPVPPHKSAKPCDIQMLI